MIFSAALFLTQNLIPYPLVNYDRTQLISYGDYIYVTAYMGATKSYFTCNMDGYCYVSENVKKPYHVKDFSPASDSFEKYIKIHNKNKGWNKYYFGSYYHEIHIINEQKSSLLLVSDDAGDTGVYTRAFYVNDGYGNEIEFLKGTSFSQDTISLSELGLLRLQYNDWGKLASGIIFDDFLNSTRWYYPLKPVASSCANPYIYGFTNKDDLNIILTYSCGNDLHNEKQLKIMQLSKEERIKISEITSKYWM